MNRKLKKKSAGLLRSDRVRIHTAHGSARSLGELPCFDRLNDRLRLQVDHCNFIAALAADKRQLAVRTERDMRRGGADSKTCSCFVHVRVDDADARFAGVRNDQPLSIRAEREKVRINTDRNASR